MLRNVCRGLGGTNMEAELKVLTRQGVARSTGTVSMMQSLRVIDKAESGAEPRPKHPKHSSVETEAEPRPKRPRSSKESPFTLGLLRQQFVTLSDPSVVIDMLDATRKHVLPKLEDEKDLQSWTDACDELLRSCPAQCKFGGSYVGPHVRRKLLLAAIRGLGPGSKKKASVGSEAEPRTLKWLDTISARTAIRLTGPDQADFASTVPAVMRAGRLSRILGAPIEFIGAFACLWKDAVDNLPDLERFLELHASILPEVLQQYIEQHKVTPCPYLLVELAMKRMSWSGASGSAKSCPSTRICHISGNHAGGRRYHASLLFPCDSAFDL